MSDRAVRSALDRMEAWVDEAAWEPDPQVLEAWNRDYQEALGAAEKGPGWPDLVARAHRIGRRLEARVSHFSRLRDEIKAELGMQERGNRALAGYGASTR